MTDQNEANTNWSVTLIVTQVCVREDDTEKG